ncbi:MAG: 3-isopropylmalate dehydratase large subunit [Thermoflexibacter sp.]|jgi:3-isopropylmalate/(R)-2-methylmalate dehydratase large subunit|nr:3-isopropylmalate dehydratase large subunit [Thermoflexibacter sp.]
MKPQTITEKILSLHTEKPVYQSELAIVNVDGIMASDTTAPYAITAFKEMNGTKVWDSSKCALVIDHAAPAPTQQISNLHKMMRDFAKEQNIRLFDVGEGICHQLMVEHRFVKPSELFIGADSHTTTYGALNAFSTGVGSTDLAAVMLTGKIWLKVPKTIRIILNGTLQEGVSAKDVILFLTGKLGIEGATYQSIEFWGEIPEKMTLASRMVLANMTIEMGAKAGIVHPSGLQLDYDFTPTFPDEGADYIQTLEYDLSHLEPQISIPHSPDNVRNINEVIGKKIDFAFVGTCTNGRLEDLHIVANILKGKQINPNVRLLIVPASKQVFLDALKDGTIQVLTEAGATFGSSGCGPCVGAHAGVPGDGEVVISAANRNFKGRMGNPKSEVYLASPAIVAASALAGVITKETK